MTKLYTDNIRSSSSICIENVFMFVYFLHLSSSLCLLVLLPVRLSEFSSCPSHMHTAALQFADPSETALKAMMRATLAPLAPPSVLHHINTANTCITAASHLRAYSMHMCVYLCPSLPVLLPFLLSRLPKCWLESFPTCWQSARRLIYCVTVHT